MSISRKAGLAALGVFVAVSLTGCSQSTGKPKTLDDERAAVRGSTPPADAGAKYLSTQGSDPGAVKAKMDAAGSAFQNRKK